MDGSSAGCRVWWDDVHGIVRSQWLPGTVCRIGAATEVTTAIAAMGREKMLALVDLRDLDEIDRPARQHFMDARADFRAVALLADSAVTGMIANFFISLKRGDVPVRTFTAEDQALDWLRLQ